MFAIILGGSMFGVLGMFIGVPVFSVIYVQVRQLVNDRLGAKHISVK
jgi:predicted PurR-regulated permease PerM